MASRILGICFLSMLSVQLVLAQQGETLGQAGEERNPNPANAAGSNNAPRRVVPAKRNGLAKDASPAMTSLRYTGLACEGYVLLMHCPGGYHINIESAFFGRRDETTCLPEPRADGTLPDFNTLQCSALQSTKFLADKCNGRNNCEALSSVALFGEPWACNTKTPKYMEVSYTCDQTIYSAFLCEASGHVPLACPPGSRIVTESAFFGRNNFHTCHHQTAMLTDQCSAPNAYNVFTKMCDGKNRCELDARTEIFGEPCDGTYKFLNVTYTCAECENDHDDDAQCEYWANIGECNSNPSFMIPQCRKACWGCSRSPPECENAYGDDLQCEDWAAKGFCESNVAWMLPYCRKACTRCNQLTTCTNRYEDDAKCRQWAEEGECGKNALWMHRNCMKACFQCSTDFMECKDLRVADCPTWKEDNQCEENPGFVMTDCFKTCTGCTAAPSCTNLHPSDSECEKWQSEDKCITNSTWMYRNCWKTCIGCGGLEGLVAVTHKVWMDIAIDGNHAGRVVFGLLGERVPLTVANFIGFAQGWNGYTYVDMPFHRVVPGFVVQGGDVWNQDGTGRISIYGPRMDDENFMTNHWGKGWVNMANAGPDDNGSQFAILLQDTPWLDGKHVVFAKILEGMYVLHSIEQVERLPETETPSVPITITSAGVVNLTEYEYVEKRPVKENQECENQYFNDAECEYWRNIGECKNNPLFMTTWCWKACSGCIPVNPEPFCKNVFADDSQCARWAQAGECQDNPDWMIPFCRKACTFCDREELQDMVGHEMLPGSQTTITTDRTFVLGMTFPEAARLTHFAAFFVDFKNVTLQVWRDYGDRMDPVYSETVMPAQLETVQSVLATRCFFVRRGDRIGFTTHEGASPIAYRFDMQAIEEPTYYRKADSTGPFDQLALPYAFSLSAFYDANGSC